MHLSESHIFNHKARIGHNSAVCFYYSVHMVWLFIGFPPIILLLMQG